MSSFHRPGFGSEVLTLSSSSCGTDVVVHVVEVGGIVVDVVVIDEFIVDICVVVVEVVLVGVPCRYQACAKISKSTAKFFSSSSSLIYCLPIDGVSDVDVVKPLSGRKRRMFRGE